MPSDPRIIPSIEQLRQRDAVRRLEARYGREATVEALREEAAALRGRLLAEAPGGDAHAPAGEEEPRDRRTEPRDGGAASRDGASQPQDRGAESQDGAPQARPARGETEPQDDASQAQDRGAKPQDGAPQARPARGETEPQDDASQAQDRGAKPQAGGAREPAATGKEAAAETSPAATSAHATSAHATSAHATSAGATSAHAASAGATSAHAASERVPRDAAEAAGQLEERAEARLALTLAPSLRSVINATGVIVHTNLGRAPLSRAAVARVGQVADGYTNLEYDLHGGRRGSRTVHASQLLTRLTGTEDAVVVNNNAAAVLLVLAALAAGREVLISRGELVEIGGGFRIPDVLRQSGALLREVGTTNRTRAADYAAAIGDRTAMILRVHPSNFRIEGFTERPTLAAVAAVGRRFDVPVVEDLGSGHLRATAATAGEPTVRASIDAGVTVCTFSGDKLLGGPQAGLIVGKREALAGIRAHPLMRALRVDKLTYAALEATLIEHAKGRAAQTVPVERMIETTVAMLEARGDAIRLTLAGIPGLTVSVVPSDAAIGGGSTPGVTLPSRALAVDVAGRSASALAGALRAAIHPVIGRIAGERLLLDLRTVDPEEDHRLVAAIRDVADTVTTSP